MSSENDVFSGTYHKNAAQPLARLILSNPDMELTPKQQEALLRVLKDSPPLWPELQTDASQTGTQQTDTRQPDALQPDTSQPVSLQPSFREDQQIPVQYEQTQTVQYEQTQTVHNEHQQTIQQHQVFEPGKKKRQYVLNKAMLVLLFVFLSAIGFLGWYFWRTTFAVFDYQVQSLVVLEGWTIDPNDFLTPGKNTQGVTVVYRNPVFTPSIGQQEVQLTLSMGWRTVNTTTKLCILTAIHEMEHEFAEAGPALKAVDFITNAEAAAGMPFDIRFTEEPKQLNDFPVGEYTLRIALNGVPFNVLLTVKDTTPPDAVSVSKSILIGEEVNPGDFVTGVTDASDHLPITISYYNEEPDIFGHDQTVAIKVEDYYGNYRVIYSGLSVRHNIEPPVIEGTGQIIINVGGVIRYMQGVTAFDDFGRDLTSMILVDDSGVDPFSVGVYPVRYEITDFSGNFIEIIETVHVLDIDMNLINEEVDSLLEGIINEDMTQLQMVRAIFSWVRGNITYAPSSERIDTAYEGAYRALREGRGNYFVYYSISELMLSRAGIPNIPINRIESSPVKHRWNLVNPDDLGWHHYDSYPIRLGLGIQMAFFTDSQAIDFTNQIANLAGSDISDYYTYDQALYPFIVQ